MLRMYRNLKISPARVRTQHYAGFIFPGWFYILQRFIDRISNAFRFEPWKIEVGNNLIKYCLNYKDSYFEIVLLAYRKLYGYLLGTYTNILFILAVT